MKQLMYVIALFYFLLAVARRKNPALRKIFTNRFDCKYD